MKTQDVLDALFLHEPGTLIDGISDYLDFIGSANVSTSTDPFERLLLSSLRAGSHANAAISGHQAAIRRLFPATPQDAICAFCVSESKGPHPRFIETRLTQEHDSWSVTGKKMWGTMAPAASILYVAASTGVIDGQNQLSMVAVDAVQSSVIQHPLPAERQVGGLPICDLSFEQSPVRDNLLFEGDAYTQYIKPFRLIEDVYGTLATQIALLRMGPESALSHSHREDLLALILQGHVISETTMDSPAHMLLISSYLSASQAHWQHLMTNWHNASSAAQENWQPQQPILTVAAKAREQRRLNAWAELDENEERIRETN